MSINLEAFAERRREAERKAGVRPHLLGGLAFPGA